MRTYHSVGGSIFEQFLIILRNSCYENNCSDTFEWEYIIIECKNDIECGREGGREKEGETKERGKKKREIDREKKGKRKRKRQRVLERDREYYKERGR